MSLFCLVSLIIIMIWICYSYHVYKKQKNINKEKIKIINEKLAERKYDPFKTSREESEKLVDILNNDQRWLNIKKYFPIGKKISYLDVPMVVIDVCDAYISFVGVFKVNPCFLKCCYFNNNLDYKELHFVNNDFQFLFDENTSNIEHEEENENN